MESIGRRVQSAIYRGGALGSRPVVPVGYEALEAEAKRRMLGGTSTFSKATSLRRASCTGTTSMLTPASAAARASR